MWLACKGVINWADSAVVLWVAWLTKFFVKAKKNKGKKI